MEKRRRGFKVELHIHEFQVALANRSRVSVLAEVQGVDGPTSGAKRKKARKTKRARVCVRSMPTHARFYLKLTDVQFALPSMRESRPWLAAQLLPFPRETCSHAW